MNIKTAKTQWTNRRRKYVVGYVASGNTLYGGGQPNPYGCTDPLSLKEARQKLADMPCANCAIFELSPVQVNR